MKNVFRTYFDELPCYVSAQDRDFRIVANNGRFARDFGAGVGKHCYEVYKGRTEKCGVCPVDRTFCDGRPHASEELVRRLDGTEICVIAYTSPIRGPGGEVESVLEISADITEVKRQQQKYQVLFEEVPCSISVQDRELRVIEGNRRFRANFGEPGTGTCYEIYKHRSEPCVVCPVAATFADGQVRSSEELVTARDGRKINTLVRAAPLRDPSGAITSVMEMSVNVTELRELQSQLATLGLVVGSISHGIKGLLSGLDGGIYLMETGFAKDDLGRTRKGWDMVRRNVDRIRSMVLNVLYYAKDRDVQWETVAPAELVADVAGVVAVRAGQLGIDLRTSVADGIGTFDADPRAVHSLLVNLLDNSLDACRVDRQKPSHAVELRALPGEDAVVFEVRDDGIGMDQETREKAFTAFFSSKGAGGTGLGLFIASKIAASHGGTIDIDSAAGVGSRLTVRLPRRRPSAPEPARPSSTPGGEHGADDPDHR